MRMQIPHQVFQTDSSPCRSYCIPASRSLRRLQAVSQAADVTVVGAGAAGLTAAYFAAKEGAEVVVIEKTPEAGKKILISGGKRCNVLPMDVELERDYFSESSKSAVRAIFSQWTLDGCKTWLETDLGLRLAFEEGSSKYFPVSNSAQEVRDRLVAACLQQGVRFQYNARLEDLSQTAECWTCKLPDQKSVSSRTVVIATGGLSFPAMGTDGQGLRLLEKLGHTLNKPYPALTPLRGTHVASMQLAGLSLYDAKVWCEAAVPGRKVKRKQVAKAERSAMLFTHRGFSGPAVLDLSHHFVKPWERQSEVPGVRINWTAEEASIWEGRLQVQGTKTVSGILKAHGVPARLAEALVIETVGNERRIAELTKAERAALIQKLVSYPLVCTGHEGYAKAEVTGGGVRLNEIDCATMESRVHPGLYLCGEVLDMFGRIGGFNFYWAWLSGRLAGLAAAKAPCVKNLTWLSNTRYQDGKIGQ